MPAVLHLTCCSIADLAEGFKCSPQQIVISGLAAHGEKRHRARARQFSEHVRPICN